MILSVSRRTDIPAFFSDWFLNRIKEQYALTRNPINPRQVSRISLSPEVVDCIVFWTKNPRPMLDELDALRDYMYYFQFTLNAYERDLEKNLPSLEERIKTFQDLAALLGKDRVIWRYDPIIINEKYTAEWHGRQYGKLARQLDGCTDRCIISFVDCKPKRSAAAAVLTTYPVVSLPPPGRHGQIHTGFFLAGIPPILSMYSCSFARLIISRSVFSSSSSLSAVISTSLVSKRPEESFPFNRSQSFSASLRTHFPCFFTSFFNFSIISLPFPSSICDCLQYYLYHIPF